MFIGEEEEEKKNNRMGLCTSKPSSNPTLSSRQPQPDSVTVNGTAEPSVSSVNGENSSSEAENGKRSPFFPFYSPSPAHNLFSKMSPANGMKIFKRSFPPPSPAKHIRAMLARRRGSVKPNEAAIPEGSEAETVAGLDKNFGFSKHFGNKYDVGVELGRGHFGYTRAAKFKKGELKGQQVAVKVIPKAKVSNPTTFTLIQICNAY